MKIIITGFDAFGGEEINPSFEAVKLLDDKICGAEIVKLQLPTSFEKSFAALKGYIDKYNPDYVLCCGQAGGITGIALEKVAVNFAYGIDNEKFSANGQPIVKGAPDGYFSTIDVNNIAEQLKQNGLPVFVSYSAGVYVCNSLLYNTLHYAKQNKLKYKTMFIHVPYVPQQVVSKPKTPSLPLEYIKHCVQETIKQLFRKDACRLDV